MASLKIVDCPDLSVMYDAEAPTLSKEALAVVTRERFIERYQDAPSLGFEINGKCIGGVILHGKLVHIAVAPEFHGRWVRLLPAVADWVFARQCPVYGVVHRDNQKAARFIERCGWGRIKTEGDYHIYKLQPDSFRMPGKRLLTV